MLSAQDRLETDFKQAQFLSQRKGHTLCCPPPTSYSVFHILSPAILGDSPARPEQALSVLQVGKLRPRKGNVLPKGLAPGPASYSAIGPEVSHGGPGDGKETHKHRQVGRAVLEAG